MLFLRNSGIAARRIALAAIALGAYCAGTYSIYGQVTPREQAAAQKPLPTTATPTAPVAMKMAPPAIGQPPLPQGQKAVNAVTPAAQTVNSGTVAWGSLPKQAFPAPPVPPVAPSGIHSKLTVPAQVQPQMAAPPYFTDKSKVSPSGRPSEGLVGKKEFCDIKANYLDANSIPYQGHLLPCTCRGKGSRSAPKGCNEFTLQDVAFP